TAISAVNLSSANGGFRGDVLVGYFNPLLESFDGPDFGNELSFMITSGLSDTTALVADTRQQITLSYDFKPSGINSLLRLNRDTGLVETVSLISDGGAKYHLTRTLDGGTGDLFKFNDGSIFVVPEASTLTLLASAATCAMLFKRQRYRSHPTLATTNHG